eukprot:TRINITY_DN10643_c0_g1_i1.p1 TRINITY_DN10643_c0_g1~~TRINITY_DN10643_c0_g1_i1.p1  ORF type:complete len:405 (-),score=105.95 TRINITY_DN10643_c0_g1_i1:24-1238(-)
MASKDISIEPGLYQFTDPKALQQLTSHQESKISENLERGQKWTLHKEEYEALYKRLENLCDQTQYQVMIPLAGSKAFMPGRLENTNEVMVLLGDNWFADRSVKQARDMVRRRIQKCDSMLKDLATEKKLFENWRKETLGMKGEGGSSEGEGGMEEIREPYDESTERQWREEHKVKVREYIMNKKNNDGSSKAEDESDNELWRRLDELEIREELEEDNSEEEDDGEEEDWSESPPLSDEEDGSESREIIVHDPSFKPPPLQRRVSFGNVTHVNLETLCPPSQSPATETNILKFSHTSGVANQNINSQELNPGHLKDLFDAPAPKSILKPFEVSSIPIVSDEDRKLEDEDTASSSSNFERVREHFLDPVKETIVEKNPVGYKMMESSTSEQPQRKASRFKLSRLNN